MFYYFLDNRRHGPVDQRALEHLIRTRVITEDTPIQKEGWKAPRRAVVVFRELFATLAPVQQGDIPQAPAVDPFQERLLKALSNSFFWFGCFVVFLILLLIVAVGSLLFGKISAGLLILFVVFLYAAGVWSAFIWKGDELTNARKTRQEADRYKAKLEAWANELKQYGTTINRANDAEIAKRADALAERYLAENVELIATKLNSSNYPLSKDRLLTVIKSCRAIGYTITADQEKALFKDLQSRYEAVLRREAEREEQARIKEQMREEQKELRRLEALREKQKQDEREKQALEKAIRDALAAAQGQHTKEIEEMQRQLAMKQAEVDAAQRTLSNAEKGIKNGNVYVISNIGSFGEGVYKIGMTRRDVPEDRVRELGDASVPFPFDVHMMIACDDAPGLENALHRTFHANRVNRVNLRKEFFFADLDEVQKIAEKITNKPVAYRADPRNLESYAEEYRNSQATTLDDLEEMEKMAERAGVGDDED